MSLIDEIKTRINIITLVNDYGLRPVNDFIYSIYKRENNRSLKLYPATNSFYCFSTGNGGDVIKFYADYWKTDMKSAVKELADRAGIIISREEVKNRKGVFWKSIPPNKEMIIFQSEKEYFAECTRRLQKTEKISNYSAELKAYDEILVKRKDIQLLVYDSLEKFCYGVDEESLDYLLGPTRGLYCETIRKFRLFSIKNVKATLEFLKDCFTSDELLISGLISKSGGFIFSFNRLIIPYLSNGKIIYLRGRSITKSSKCKYLGLRNVAENLSLKRYYNFDTIKLITKNEILYICEGEFDTIIMEQFGSRAVGIPGVTNIPSSIIDLIRNHNVCLAFDNDEAGRRAVQKITNLLGKPVKVLQLKNHKDISELFNARH